MHVWDERKLGNAPSPIAKALKTPHSAAVTSNDADNACQIGTIHTPMEENASSFQATEFQRLSAVTKHLSLERLHGRNDHVTTELDGALHEVPQPRLAPWSCIFYAHLAPLLKISNYIVP